MTREEIAELLRFIKRERVRNTVWITARDVSARRSIASRTPSSRTRSRTTSQSRHASPERYGKRGERARDGGVRRMAPEQVQAAFDDAFKAGADRERLKNEGQAYANDVIPKAKGTAARLLEEAGGHKQRVISTAEGDASRFKQVQVEYAKAPEVTRQRMYLETMQQIYSNTSKVLIDAKGQGNLLYLPLDKLLQARIDLLFGLTYHRRYETRSGRCRPWSAQIPPAP